MVDDNVALVKNKNLCLQKTEMLARATVSAVKKALREQGKPDLKERNKSAVKKKNNTSITTSINNNNNAAASSTTASPTTNTSSNNNNPLTVPQGSHDDGQAGDNDSTDSTVNDMEETINIEHDMELIHNDFGPLTMEFDEFQA